MSFLDQIDKSRIPQHVAIIMDGNGRWARLKGFDRVFGHREGLAAVKRVIKAASEIEIGYVTLYTFSTENWMRPAEEVSALMALMIKAVADETDELVQNNIKVNVIGDLERLPADTQKALDDCLQRTSVSTGSEIILALSYSSKWELTRAMKLIAEDVKDGKVNAQDIDESLIGEYLQTKGIPNPDLMIRTGGEFRLSNFLLWQSAYSELYFTDELWPDFNQESLYKAVVDYQSRERRFGKTSDQIVDQSK